MAETKHGIKHNAGIINAISVFPDGVLEEGFVEITQEDYDNFLAVLSAHPLSYYNSELNVLEYSAAAETEANRLKSLRIVREKLLKVSNEIGLSGRLLEETTEMQSQFDQLKVDYDALKVGG